MRMNEIEFKKVMTFNPYSNRADKNGYVKEWYAYNSFGNSIAWGYTKKECMDEARFYCRNHK